MERGTKASGLMIGSMAADEKSGLMGRSLRVSTPMERRMGWASKFGMMATGIRVSLKIT